MTRLKLSARGRMSIPEHDGRADQWGVHLGRALATRIAEELRADGPELGHDSSTNALIVRYRSALGRSGSGAQSVGRAAASTCVTGRWNRCSSRLGKSWRNQ
jgi:hypothetical protein